MDDFKHLKNYGIDEKAIKSVNEEFVKEDVKQANEYMQMAKHEINTKFDRIYRNIQKLQNLILDFSKQVNQRLDIIENKIERLQNIEIKTPNLNVQKKTESYENKTKKQETPSLKTKGINPNDEKIRVENIFNVNKEK